jgi:hypothetical protein
MKRTVLTFAAAAALAIAAVPSTAGAQRWGGHWGGGHWGGHHFGWGGPSISFGVGVAPYYDYDYYACPVHRVWTPYGWRWRRWC